MNPTRQKKVRWFRIGHGGFLIHDTTELLYGPKGKHTTMTCIEPSEAKLRNKYDEAHNEDVLFKTISDYAHPHPGHAKHPSTQMVA